jgi:DNA-binding PadR family transcriptional regulator
MSSKNRSAAPVPADLTPLTPALFHILLSLGEGERHGYALKREIALRTAGKLMIGPGVLYGSINKMLELGLIEESDNRPDPHLDDERRRYYRITSYGRKVAQAEAARMRELVELATAKFGVPRYV